MKALFFDIDGTLLSEITKEIPQSALDALKKTAEKGNLTFINTGRTWSELPEELKKLPSGGRADPCLFRCCRNRTRGDSGDKRNHLR